MNNTDANKQWNRNEAAVWRELYVLFKGRNGPDLQMCNKM